MGERQSIIVPVLIYILLVILTYFTFNYLAKNILLLSLVLPIIILIIISIFLRLKPSKTITPDKKSVRYTMHCLKCNWEWMSNVADKAPQQCPNCHEKEKLEVIGWRQVLTKEKKSNVNLKKYI